MCVCVRSAHKKISRHLKQTPCIAAVTLWFKQLNPMVTKEPL